MENIEQTNFNLNDEFYEFIRNNKNVDINVLRLKKYRDKTFNVKFAILQIECQKKAISKIPEILLHNSEFIFPSTTVAEQCTSEVIAKFHASLFASCKTVLDMTAGLCIDSYYISKVVDSVTALEIDNDYVVANVHNMSRLAANINVLHCNSAEYVSTKDFKIDAIFVDPARRGEANSRIFALSDCSPNIIPLIPYIRLKCNFIIIKASPMIDISDTLMQIENVTDIWVLGYKNECKELLIKVDFKCEACDVRIHTINFETNNGRQEFSYIIGSNPSSPTPLCEPKVNDYLYEPNCCIMKSGAFNELSSKFTLSKLHNNTHLFISKGGITDFPGRVFVIDEIIPFKDKLVKKLNIRYPKINVSVRNFKLTAEQLKAKLKIKDGGESYLFGVTLQDNSLALIICHKSICRI